MHEDKPFFCFNNLLVRKSSFYLSLNLFCYIIEISIVPLAKVLVCYIASVTTVINHKGKVSLCIVKSNNMLVKPLVDTESVANYINLNVI